MESRDKEIERLNRQLDGGRPVDAVLREGKKDSSERVVAHLNVQVCNMHSFALPAAFAATINIIVTSITLSSLHVLHQPLSQEREKEREPGIEVGIAWVNYNLH